VVDALENRKLRRPVIETFSSPGYLMVGTNYVNSLSSNIYLVSYYNPLGLIVQVQIKVP
jgi:hypothetical protein